MEREELVGFLKKNHIVRDKDISDQDLARSIIDFFKNSKFEYFADYSDGIKYLFSVAELLTYKELVEIDYADKFLGVVLFCLNYAGEQGERGYDYNGINTIQKNSGKLKYKYIYEILRYSDQFKDGGIGNSLRTKVIKSLIDSCELDDIDKKKLKFRFFDSYLLCRISMKKISAYIQRKYSEYKYIDIDEINPNDAQRAIFFLALEDKGKYLYVKVDRTAEEKLFISLTPNFDPNDMKDYILDMSFNLTEMDMISVDLLRDGVNPIDTFELGFSYSNWDNNAYDNSPDIDVFLQNELNGIYREEFELVYFYAEKAFGLSEREIYFQNDVQVNIDTEKINLTRNEQIEFPKNFYGAYINNIVAVIGRNGSGKSSIFKMISSNPIFCKISKDDYVSEWGNYLIIYRMGKNYYYNKSLGKNIVYSGDDLSFKERDDKVDVNICLISNTFDVHSIKKLDDKEVDHENKDVGKLFGFIDFTTSNMLKYGFEKYKEMEIQRINNLKNFLSKGKMIQKLELKIHSDVSQLSSGEYARWSLFARILSLFYKQNQEDSILPEIEQKENYFILFDEAELYLHPEWQRKLIWDVINFIDYINGEQRFFSNITLIFSSNSPFLMSDLPTEKIQLFEGKQTKRTFGQNIYDILKDNFFMPDVAIGALAQTKISEAFKDKDKMNEVELKTAEYVASILGDELLLSMLRRRLNV